MAATVEENYYWFKKHVANLVKNYQDLYVVIKDKQVYSAYKSFTEAYDDMVFVKKESLGTFIIQLCSLDERKTSVKVYTPVLQDSNIAKEMKS